MVTNVQIDAGGYYDSEAVGKLLKMSPAAITRAVNSGQLRCSIRGGRKWYRGQWLIDWLEGKETKPQTGESK